MTGIPCSGKTTRTLELKKYFETTKEKKVNVISEIDVITKASYDRNSFYSGKRLALIFYIFKQ